MQLVLASKSKPLLSEVIPVYEEFIENLEGLMKDKPEYTHLIRPAWEVACKYYKWTDKCAAYAINMCRYIHTCPEHTKSVVISLEPEIQVQGHRSLGRTVQDERAEGDQGDGEFSSYFPCTTTNCCIL